MDEAKRILNVNDKHPCAYAIPLWLRDEQIKLAVANVKGRIQPHYEKRLEPIAVVGFGPSLLDTWEKIREFKFVMTCSGSHKFLIERQIIPTWHVEVDPRSHKIELLGSPHAEVEYLISSTCHPDYFKHLSGFNVKLWHVFDASEDGKRLLPPGEWAITGGCDVGLRALTISAFLGFRELHVFGLDGCARGEDRHAAAHPNGKQKYAETEYHGKTYFTTPAMLEAAKQTLHELKQLPAVKATFYGEGLTQAMIGDYVSERTEPVKPMANVVGFSKPELISAEYLELNTRLHRDNLAYGVGGGRHADTVIKLAKILKKDTDFVSVLDYGCGKSYLAKELPFPIAEYDPAILGKQESPRPADLVVCTDVLEHIEPERLLFVLDDLRRVVRKLGYFVIHTGPSSKHLADDRNSHLIQQGPDWWQNTLSAFFHITQKSMIWKPPLLYLVVVPKVTKSKSISAMTRANTSPTMSPATAS